MNCQFLCKALFLLYFAFFEFIGRLSVLVCFRYFDLIILIFPPPTRPENLHFHLQKFDLGHMDLFVAPLVLFQEPQYPNLKPDAASVFPAFIYYIQTFWASAPIDPYLLYFSGKSNDFARKRLMIWLIYLFC